MAPIWVYTIVFGLWLVLLVGASLLLLYPTVRYPHRVLHVNGVRGLALAIFLLTVGALVESTYWTGLTASVWALAAARGLIALSATMMALAMWNFARPVVESVDREVGELEGPEDGGMRR